MNEKIQAILLKIILELKKLGWSAGPDWQITLKSDGNVPLIKQIHAEGTVGSRDFTQAIEAYIDLKLGSDDRITYFPDYNIYANIFVDGGGNKDIAIKMDCDVAFTEKDYTDRTKAGEAAKKIDRLVHDHIQHEFTDYLDDYAENIHDQSSGHGEPDIDGDR